MDWLMDIGPEDYRICKDALTRDEPHPAHSLAAKRWGDQAGWEVVVDLWEEAVRDRGPIAHMIVWEDQTITVWPGEPGDYQDQGALPWETRASEVRAGSMTEEDWKLFFTVPRVERIPVDFYELIPYERLTELREMVSLGRPQPPTLTGFEQRARERLSREAAEAIRHSPAAG